MLQTLVLKYWRLPMISWKRKKINTLHSLCIELYSLKSLHEKIQSLVDKHKIKKLRTSVPCSKYSCVINKTKYVMEDYGRALRLARVDIKEYNDKTQGGFPVDNTSFFNNVDQLTNEWNILQQDKEIKAIIQSYENRLFSNDAF